MGCELSLILYLVTKINHFTNGSWGFLPECLPLCFLPLLFMMADLVLGCCNTKVQFQHIPQLWLAHMKQSFTMPKTCSSSVSAMKHGRTEWETSGAWSRCTFAVFAEGSFIAGEKIQQLLPETLGDRGINCMAWWLCCSALLISPCPHKSFQ